MASVFVVIAIWMSVVESDACISPSALISIPLVIGSGDVWETAFETIFNAFISFSCLQIIFIIPPVLSLINICCYCFLSYGYVDKSYGQKQNKQFPGFFPIDIYIDIISVNDDNVNILSEFFQ
jgi:hypothetical protein